MFHQLKINSIEKETSECVSIGFEVPEALRTEFKFKQGQHLTLRAILDGEDCRRSYSLCSSPLDNEWRVAVKKLEGGKFSTYANEVLKKGDVLEVMPPGGHFYTELSPAHTKHYVAFAAGSGITPIMSMMKTVLKMEPQSRFTLFYVNRRVKTIIFREAIEGLKNKYMGRLDVHYFLSKERLEAPLFNGRIDGPKVEEILAKFQDIKAADEFFLCGPEEMVFAVKNQLVQSGISDKKVHFELFVTTSANKKREERKEAGAAKGPSSHVVIKDGGKTFEFDLVRGDYNILDAALFHGADLPFACKGGVCSTCKAKLVEGSVEMDVNYALEHDEVEAGYILTCQAHPTTERVVVDYDQAL